MRGVVATFNNISTISWRSVLLVEDTGVARENYRPAATHCQTTVLPQLTDKTTDLLQLTDKLYQPAATH
jgi:predicted component of type VI protein secretion system